MISGSDHIQSAKAKEIYLSIRRHGTVSKLVLLEESGLTASTLTRILEELRAQSLILEVGLGESTGGRRPVLYETNPTYAYLFGVEISRTHSRLVLFDLHLHSLGSVSWKMNASLTPDRLIQLITEHVPTLLKTNNIEKERVLGIGIGAVGPLDRKLGIILNPTHFPAEGWTQVPIKERLEQLLGLPVYLDNGANTGLLGEYWLSDNRQQHQLLYLHAGIGMRSAIMNEGRIFYGVMDTEGAVGQMIIESAGVPSDTPGGNYGAWESYVSIQNLITQAVASWKQGRTVALSQWANNPDELQFAHLIAALQAGDPVIIELFRQAAAYFGIGLANLINILHPEEVILGGPLFSSNDFFFEETTRIALEKTYYRQYYNVRFTKGQLGDAAVSTGAAALVLSKLTE
ncbi:ROK family protein [Gorillibacterium massiliense]|uniref:ROK family protein n=1 Tax=Gorillibacterium massiliense TaxID=1280390 RepID=UPI0004B4D200|nr:ROK family protein [Gorillibacterium massiliense]